MGVILKRNQVPTSDGRRRGFLKEIVDRRTTQYASPATARDKPADLPLMLFLELRDHFPA